MDLNCLLFAHLLPKFGQTRNHAAPPIVKLSLFFKINGNKLKLAPRLHVQRTGSGQTK